MFVPNGAQAVIADTKITDYLLRHPGKEKFFQRFGFTLAQWQMLRDALLWHIVTHEYVKEILLDDGVKYVVEGALSSPDGRNPRVRSGVDYRWRKKLSTAHLCLCARLRIE